MAHRSFARVQDVLGNSRDSLQHNKHAIQCGPGIRGRDHKPDTDTYRKVAVQLVGSRQIKEGFAHEHFDQYRALAGKRLEMPNSQRTRELLAKTRTKG
jgi:hypothetical protein